MNVKISLTPVWISMNFLPVGHNPDREGTVSQIFDIGPSFDLMIKNGKLFVIVFLTFTFHEMKNNTSIKILRHRTLHIYHENV